MGVAGPAVLKARPGALQSLVSLRAHAPAIAGRGMGPLGGLVQLSCYRDSRIIIDSAGRLMPWASEKALVVLWTMFESVAFWLPAL
jgi:hypothetical protein